ncbi:Flp family type IVb pilin [Pimelobacter simplex]|uniref:Flp family type IVb pilin n=1 Tax=Nocardioides simplex TaxID=2045 RepID=UPI003AAE8BB4
MNGRKPDERGATAVEYALLVTLIAAMMVGAVLLFGDGVGGLFGDAQQSVEHVVGP